MMSMGLLSTQVNIYPDMWSSLSAKSSYAPGLNLSNGVEAIRVDRVCYWSMHWYLVAAFGGASLAAYVIHAFVVLQPMHFATQKRTR